MEATQLTTAMQHAVRVAKAGDPGRKTIYRIYLADEDGQAVIYATDSYHAIRVDTGRKAPDHIGFTPIGLTLNPKSKAVPTYIDLLQGDTEYKAPATIGSLFYEGRDVAVPYRTSIPRRTADMRAATFGYFDGERRRPKALVDLTFSTKGCDPDRIDVLYRNGLKVEAHDEMNTANTGIYWQASEPERPVLGSLEVDTKARKRLDGSDGAMFAAMYLWPLAGASAIGYVNPHKPLYVATLGGAVSYVIMPIRR